MEKFISESANAADANNMGMVFAGASLLISGQPGEEPAKN
jgi:hypothetical protein